jgi:cell division protein FtsI (penicillin-binding protein 3)
LKTSSINQRFRFVCVAIFVFSLFTLLIVQFYKIQIFDHDKWVHVAKSQHQTVVKEPFKRGIFYSNTNLKKGHIEEDQPLVIDVLAYHVHIDPFLIPESFKKEMSDKLCELLKLPQNSADHFYKKSRYRRIATMISTKEKEVVEGFWNDYAKKRKLPKNALYFVKDYQRSYPFGKMLGQVLQTVREEKEEKTHQAIPTGGLEVVFHKYLKGSEGSKVILRSPRYEIDSDFLEIPPKDGADVHLTINHILQAIVEEELAKGIRKVHGKSGFAVMMNPFTGEIYAMAHYPFFDPSHYRDYYNDPKKLEETRIKAITDCFEPGSTTKAITLAIALKANQELISRGKKPIFSPKEMMRCDNHMFPGRTQPLKDVTDHKFLNMYMAIQKSSNVYPARLVQHVVETLGPNWYRDQLVNVFGYGEKTGIELPYENPGMVPTPGKKYSNGNYEWSLPTPYSLAIGYNLLVNSIQVVRAFSVFANGGYLVKPTLLRKIVSKEGVIVDNTTSRPMKKVLDDAIVKEMVKAMKYTTKPGGGATLGDISGFTEAGKTSTSEKLIAGQYSKTKHFSTFVGFAPVEEPQFVLFVGVDEPEKMYIPGFGTTHFGGKCAAPIFREIGKRTLEYLGVHPDDSYGYPKSDPRSSIQKADWMKEVSQLNELYKKYNEA